MPKGPQGQKRPADGIGNAAHSVWQINSANVSSRREERTSAQLENPDSSMLCLP